MIVVGLRGEKEYPQIVHLFDFIVKAYQYATIDIYNFLIFFEIFYLILNVGRCKHPLLC